MAKRQRVDSSTARNKYSGYTIKKSSESIPRVPSTTSPQEFFTSYILPRRPCIVTGRLTDDAWAGDNWSNSYLSKIAGDKIVRVERRREKKDSAGEGDVSTNPRIPPHPLSV